MRKNEGRFAGESLAVVRPPLAGTQLAIALRQFGSIDASIAGTQL